eukprot:2573059-Rhodomonas_salina.2
MGVFSNPTSKEAPAKLRVAFEVAPFGLLVEKAGGKTSDGVSGGSVLDITINAVDQRTVRPPPPPLAPLTPLMSLSSVACTSVFCRSLCAHDSCASDGALLVCVQSLLSADVM